GQHLANALARGVRLFAEERVRGGQHAGRAEAALQRMVLAKRRLQRAQILAVRKAFDRGDLRALGLGREHEAGAHGRAVDDDGACAAHAVLAGYVRTRAPQVMTQAVGKRSAHRHLRSNVRAVQLEPDRSTRHCTVMFAVFTRVRHFSVSRFTKSPNSCGGFATGVAPSSVMRFWMSGSAKIRLVSPWILSTTSAGVLAGAKIPTQAVASNPGSTSLIAGTSGSAPFRSRLATPSARRS